VAADVAEVLVATSDRRGAVRLDALTLEPFEGLALRLGGATRSPLGRPAPEWDRSR
jgi:hypothetical protein